MIDEKRLNVILDGVRIRTLANGITALHVPGIHDEKLYLGAVFRTGSRNEMPKFNGISHFLEHMMFRGSKNYPSFLKLADAFEWLGGEWNAETGIEHTEYSFDGSTHSLEESITLFGEFLCEPLLLDLESERDVILREIEEELNEFDNSTDASYQMNRILWPGSSAARPIAGTKSSVQGISSDDLWDYRAARYHSRSLALYVAGGQDSERILDAIAHRFGGYPLSAAPPEAQTASPEEKPLPSRIKGGPFCELVRDTDSQYHLQLSFVCGGEFSDETSACEMITRILADNYSSRLPLRLREELGLVYDVDCDTILNQDAGSIDISAYVTPENAERFVLECCRALAALKNEGPDESEMAKNLKRALIDLSLEAQDPESLGSLAAWSLIFNDRKRANLSANEVVSDAVLGAARRLTDLDREKIREVSQSIFTRENCGVLMIGPEDRGLLNKLRQIVCEQL